MPSKAKARNPFRRSAAPKASPFELVRLVRTGMPYGELSRFQKASGLPWKVLCEVLQLPPRTLARRRTGGRLQPNETDRAVRVISLFDLIVDFFEGDVVAASTWFLSPQRGLGGESPARFAESEIGAREVERLVLRLAHGVIA